MTPIEMKLLRSPEKQPIWRSLIWMRKSRSKPD
jgi:hypothetical protein